MSGSYGCVLENAARAPKAPCVLEAPLAEAWSTTAYAAALHAPLLAAGGRLFLHDTQHGPLALDPASRKFLWKYPWPASLRLLHDGHLFLWLEAEDLHVVDAATGRPARSLHLWRSTEVVAAGSNLIGGGSDHAYGGVRLYAADWTTGRRWWVEHLTEATAIESMSAAESAFFYKEIDSRPSPSHVALVARRTDTGAEMWRKDAFDLRGFAAVHGDRIVACAGDRVWAFRTEDGAVLWEAEGGPGYSYGDRFYSIYRSYRPESRYRIFDVASGKLIRSWDLLARTPKSLNAVPTHVLLVSETHVYVGAEWNTLLAFTRDGAEYVWNHRPKLGHLRGAAASVDGRLYYRNGDTTVYCLESRG